MTTLTLMPLEWDSRQLGLDAAALDGLEQAGDIEALPAPRRREAVFAALAGAGADLILAKVDQACPGLLTDLLAAGGRYIGTECVFVHAGPCADAGPVPPGAEVEFAPRCDPGPFLELAGDMRCSRFALDPNLPADVARRLWEESLGNHCRGLADELAVLRVDGTPAGLVVLGISLDAGAGMKIVGMRRAFRSRGLGRVLVDAVVRRHAHAGALSVEAFSANRAAVGLYQRCGFRLAGLRHVVHLWPGKPFV